MPDRRSARAAPPAAARRADRATRADARSGWALVGAALLLAACGGADVPVAGSPDTAAAATASAGADRMRRFAAAPSQGRWSEPVDLGFVPAAGANVPVGSEPGAGRVVMWSAENQFSFGAQGQTAPNIRTWTANYDVLTGVATASRQDATGHNMFCPGTANLPDGRLLVSGGSVSRVTSLYDPATDSWSRAPGTVLNIPRAYHASVPLRDGTVFALGGSWNGGVGGKDGELWDPVGGWRLLPGVPVATFQTADPGGPYRSDNHMWLMPTGNGRILHAGPAVQMHWIDPRGNGSVSVIGPRGTDGDAMQGSAVMYEPGRILVTGGAPLFRAGTATANAHLIDATGEVTVTRLPDMGFRRVYHNSVVLPNGQVMIIGGKGVSISFDDSGARMAPELFDPATRTFTTLPAMSVPRTYHSWALLLPDARVLVAGGGLCNCVADQPRMQVYTPHYLFNPDGTPATRPSLTAAPAAAEFGTELQVTTDVPVASFSLVRLSSATHTINNDQRRIPLQVVSSAGTSYRLAAPSNPGWAMPGHYMLFAIDARGVPSLARTVRIGLGTAPLVDLVADQQSVTGAVVAPVTVRTVGTASDVAFSATGLPPGLSIAAATGVVSGSPTQSGTWRVSVTARTAAGATSTEFSWRVQGAGSAPTARWVRIEQLSEVSGGPWGSMAEFQLLSPQGAVLPRTGWTATASSAELVGEPGAPANALDGNPASFWHTQWLGTVTPLPHTFTVDMGGTQALGGFRYLPRPVGDTHGVFARYNLYLSQDGVNWGAPVASGDLTTVVPDADRFRTVRFASAPPANRAPVVTPPANQSTPAGAPVNLSIVATDPDGDAFALAATGLPPGLALGSGGVVAGVPTTAGLHRVTITATDARGAVGTAAFDWTVVAATLPVIDPVAAPAVAAGGPARWTVSATGGTGLTYAWDFGDGTPLTAFSSSPTASHAFASPGVFTVTVHVRTVDGGIARRSFLQAVTGAPATASPARSSSMMAIEPRVGASARLWVVNPDHGTVGIVDAVTRQRLAVAVVGRTPTSVAVSPAGSVWVVNRESATISVFQGTFQVARTITLARASQPHGLVFAPDGSAYVTLAATGEVQRIGADFVPGPRVAVGPDVREIAVTGDGARLLVSRFVTPPLPGESTATVDTSPARGAEVVMLDTAPLAVRTTVVLRHSDLPDTAVQGRGIPNYLGAPAISPDGRTAWVPSKQDNVRRGPLRDGQPLDFQNTVRAISSRIDLAAATAAEVPAARLDHDNASLASAALFHPNGAYLFVALETSRQVALVDPVGRAELVRLPVGRAPQALAVSPDGRRLFVSNFMDRSVTTFDLAPLLDHGEPGRIAALGSVRAAGTEKLTAPVLAGKQLFYDAADRRLSRDSYMSCASCHRDGAGDGRVWDLTGLGEGLRNTVSLRGRAGMGHGALHWSANFDEVQDFEAQIRALAGGTGLMSDAQFATGTRSQPLGDPKAGVSADLDALAAYVASLNTLAMAPGRTSTGALTPSAAAGRTLFRTLACATCHGGAAFTGSTLAASGLRDVGTVKAASGRRLGGPLPGIDPPTLRDVWATAPYLHDGSAATVEAAIRAHTGPGMPNAAAVGALTPGQLLNLADYVRQIGREEPAPPVPTTP